MNRSAHDNKLALAKSFIELYLPDDYEEDFVEELISCLYRKAYSYRPGTWRNRRNALAYSFSYQGYEDIADKISAMVNPLTASKATRALVPKKQTRTHKVSDKDHQKMTTYLQETGDIAVLGAVTLAKIIGIRPTEMRSLKFDDIQKSIFVIGAKKREKGDRGIDRKLLLDSEDYLTVKAAYEQLMTEFNRTDALPERAMKRIQNRLYKQVRKIFNERKSYPSLYSYRHQFGSDLKSSGMDRITIAAIMGHASVDSVNVYGSKRHGGRKMNIDVSDKSLNAVSNVKVTSPPSKSDAAEKANADAETDNNKPVTLALDVTDTDEADSFSDETRIEENPPTVMDKEAMPPVSPQPKTKMINGSKATML